MSCPKVSEIRCNIGSIATQGHVQALRETEKKSDNSSNSINNNSNSKSSKFYMAKIKLNRPVCSPDGEKISLSRKIDGKWRLIGWGLIEKGIPFK